MAPSLVASLGYVGAPLRDGVDDALSAKQLYRLAGSAAGDTVSLLQVALGRDRRARRQLAALDLAANDRGKLLVDGDRVVVVHFTVSHTCHAR
jgi:hypothetical protein